MSTFSRKYSEYVFNEIEVIVEGAATMEEAADIAEQYVSLGEGKYRVSGTTGVYVDIISTCQDSDLEEAEFEDEWEGDEDDDTR